MMSGKLPKVSVIGGERVIKCKFNDKPTSSCAMHNNTNDDLS